MRNGLVIQTTPRRQSTDLAHLSPCSFRVPYHSFVNHVLGETLIAWTALGGTEKSKATGASFHQYPGQLQGWGGDRR